MARKPNQDRRYWLTHGYFRTYSIAARIAAIAQEPIRHVRELEALTVDGGILAFVQNWQKESALHRFVRWVADELFVEDTSGPYVVAHEIREDVGVTVHRYLPVDLALRAYGISHDDPFEVPQMDGETVRIGPNVTSWKESDTVSDAYYKYLMEELRLSKAYDDLLTQIADEVFHTMFHNRVAMAGLNTYLSWHVQDLDPEDMVDDPALSSLFLRPGRLKRVGPPKWVRRAVFFRDHGRCAWCGADLSGLIDALPAKQFDHIVPLADGGLNDVTNLQLLCQPCNRQKSAKSVRPSSRYRRLYDL